MDRSNGIARSCLTGLAVIDPEGVGTYLGEVYPGRVMSAYELRRRFAAVVVALLWAFLPGCRSDPAAEDGARSRGTPAPSGTAGVGSASCSSFPGEPLATDGPSAAVRVLQEGGDGRPRVEAVVYPHPDYEGHPWSQWGQGVVLSDGRFISAIGDHLGRDGNSYLYEYRPDDGTLTLVADVLSYADHQPGAWGYGKIHGQMALGPCGEIYFSTYWGDRDELTFSGSYRGDLLFRLDPDITSIANLGVPIEAHGIPSLTGWAEGGLLYGEAVDPLSESNSGPFFAYDIERGEVVFRDDDPSPVGFRNVAVDAGGRAYYSVTGGRLARYDPETGETVDDAHQVPGERLRASTHAAPDGTVYAVFEDPHEFLALEPSGSLRQLGTARGYTASLALHPDGDRFLYVPEAHGKSWEQGAPLIAVDTRTGEQTVVVELNPLAEDHLGLRLGGSYNVAVDPSGRVVYVGMNAGAVESEETFGEVALFVVHLS
jgi:hypothetical protein